MPLPVLLRRLLLLALPALQCCAPRPPAAVAAPVSAAVPIFSHGEGPCTCIGIPTVVAVPGALLAFGQCRVGLDWAGTDGCFVQGAASPGNATACGRNGAQNLCVVLKRSADEGRSWSRLSVVESANPGGSTMPVFDAQRNALVLNYEDPVDLPPEPFVDQTPALYSTVASSIGPEILEAAAWSPAQRIAIAPGGWAATPGPNAGVQLPAQSPRPGRLVFMGASNNTGSTCALQSWWSDDGGRSYTPAQGGRAVINGSCEPGLAVLPNGHLMALGDDSARSAGGPCPGDTLLHALSLDGGETFGKVRCAVPGSACQASILAAANGSILVSNPQGPASRHGMTISRSTDSGNSFHKLDLNFTSGGANGTWAGYSSLVALPSGRVGLAWETADSGKCFGERCRVVFSTFALPRLKAGDEEATPPGPGSWYNCISASSCIDAPFNGSRSIPFLGLHSTADSCRLACEAMPDCLAYCGAGTTPHISPEHNDWRMRCYGRRDTVWKLVPMADEHSGCSHQRNPKTCPDPAPPARWDSADSLSVDVGACLHRPGARGDGGGCRISAGVASGILLSINETHPSPSVIAPLNLRAHRGDYDHLPAQFARLTSLGITTKQVLLPDLWVQEVTGHNSFTTLQPPPAGVPACANPGCWPCDNGNCTRWQDFVERTVAAAPAGLMYDIWNEPGMSPGGYFWYRNWSQYKQMWHTAVVTIKRVRPDAQVTGPSISSFDLAFLRPFFAAANATDTLPDVLTWHEFSADGRDIPANVATARAMLAEFGIPDTQISINEMVPAGSNFLPAVHISYFANLERAAVDSACHSCWQSACPDGAVPPCFNCAQSDRFGVHGGQSLDGLLTDDTELPRSVWWTYKAYGALIGGKLLVVNASSELDGVAALSADGHSVSMAVGRVGGATGVVCGGASTGSRNLTDIVLQNVPATVLSKGGQSASVAVATIANSGTAALHTPAVSTGAASVDAAGTVTVKLTLQQGEAALVVLGREAELLIGHFATAPE